MVQHRPTSGRHPRKFHAVRSLQQSKQSEDVDKGSKLSDELVISTPPWLAGTRRMEGASREEIYSLINDRYPGAPGTALARAEEAKVRTASMQKRETNRKSAARAEWEHLGLNNLGKKRKSSSPYASEAGSTVGSDTESSTGLSRGSRTRRISSRHSTPVHLGVEPEGLASRLAAANAPVRPSPLATQTVLSEDSKG